MSIKSALEKITPEDKKRLLYAFDNNFCQVVGLSNQRFIGVNCKHVVNLKITEQKGAWATGVITK